jgi:hypothetical protein
MEERSLHLLLMQIQYPGMPALESNIARHWIRAHGADYDRMEFNVRVGQGAPIAPGIDDATARQFQIITQKRIDVVAYKGNLVDLIEVKRNMTLGALGQLQGYQHLWQEDVFRPHVDKLIAVAQIIDPDIRRVLDANGVTYYQLEPEEQHV